jgi:hypothetical protein
MPSAPPQTLPTTIYLSLYIYIRSNLWIGGEPTPRERKGLVSQTYNDHKLQKLTIVKKKIKPHSTEQQITSVE